jgi:hypothetical protein
MHLYVSKNNNKKQIKYAEEIIRNKTLICPEKYLLQEKIC